MKRSQYPKHVYLVVLIPAVVVSLFLLFPPSGRGVVDIDAGSFKDFFTGDKAAVQILSKTLKNNPTAKEFRVRYTTSRGGGQIFRCQVDYDRQGKRLSERSIRSSANYRYSYIGVTDTSIHKVAQNNGALSDVKNGGKRTGIRLAQDPDYFSWLKFRLFNR